MQRESGLKEGAYPHTVAARIALQIGFYSPQRWAGNITCPALVQIVAQDAIIPKRVAERAAGKMRHSTVRGDVSAAGFVEVDDDAQVVDDDLKVAAEVVDLGSE
ncbi:hypothetical protein GCM10010293_49780 [Streptomyces griseoflavus]|nr:hypothetical protein GCM10010293_49780 [Streptomyces griseoflavus]